MATSFGTSSPKRTWNSVRMPKATATTTPRPVGPSLAEQAGGLQEQTENQDDEDQDVLPSRVVRQLDELADDADEPSAEESARDAADAAEHGRHERARADDDAHRRIHLRLIEAV